MFDEMYIPWTPRFRRPSAPKPEPAPEPAKPQAPYCNRTLHFARAIVAHATTPFPEIAGAISAAFVAFIRGRLLIDTTGEPSSWAVEPVDLPLHPRPAAP